MGAFLGAACPPWQGRPFRKARWRAFLRVSSLPAALGDKLWWADQVSEKMGTCNKADGSGSVVLRNSTTLVMHMKVYDESIQLGEAGGEGPGWQDEAQRGRGCGQDWLQEPLGKWVNGNENEAPLATQMGSSF